MTLDLIIHEKARHDVNEQSAWLDDHTPDAGDRFHDELAHVFDRLVTFPAFGQPCPTKTYPDLRRAILPTFPLSVFYRPTATAIEVFRVLHHARDLANLLDDL